MKGFINSWPRIMVQSLPQNANNCWKRHDRALKEVTHLRNEARTMVRAARKDNRPQSEIALLTGRFISAKEHSKLQRIFVKSLNVAKARDVCWKCLCHLPLCIAEIYLLSQCVSHCLKPFSISLFHLRINLEQLFRRLRISEFFYDSREWIRTDQPV